MTTKVGLTPTNIITGFLGVGKTTAILHLLDNKPSDERWAVLVNEFGEIGIDGELIKGKSRAGDIFIKEVPGGCMCCTAGLPMQVALNILLQQAKPDRLLIEPTGLGHPKEVLQVLSARHYQDVLDIQSTITLVDARKVADRKYTEHPVFTQQLDVADVLIANKMDQYQIGDFDRLQAYLAQQNWDNKPLYQACMGQLSVDCLQGKTTVYDDVTPQGDVTSSFSTMAVDLSALSQQALPACGYLSYEREQEGVHTRGWRFKEDFIFDRQALYELILTTPMERIKGVFITEQGVRGYNMSDDVLTELPLDEAMDSRVEIIFTEAQRDQAFEAKLLKLAQTY